MADRKPTVLNPAGYQENLQDTDNLVVEAAPTADNHATNKLFVDTEVAAAGKWSETSGVLHPKVATNDVWIGTYQDPTVKFTAATGNADFDGSITAAGAIRTGDAVETSSSTFGIIDPSGQIVLQNNLGDNTKAVFTVFDGTYTAGQEKIKMLADGSITAAGDVKIGGTLPSAPNIELKASDGSASFAGTVQTNSFFQIDGNSNTIDNDAGIYLRDSGSSGWKTTILADGSATFAGYVTATGFNAEPANALDSGLSVKAPGAGTSFYVDGSGTVRLGPLAGSAPNITLNSDGSATFAGKAELAGQKHNFFTDGEAQLAGNKVNIQPSGSITAAGEAKFGETIYAKGGSPSEIVFYGLQESDAGSFDPSNAQVTITAGGSATFAGNITAASFTGPVTGDITGDITGNINGNVNGNVTGNADTATKLKNARTIALSGDVSGSASFDGSSNITISSTVADSNKLDGLNSSQFLRSDTADSATGDITFTGGAGAATIGSGSDIQFTNGGWTGDSCKIQQHENKLYIQAGTGGINFRDSGGTNNATFNSSGNFVAGADNGYDIGATGTLWRKVYAKNYSLESLPTLP